MAKLRSSKLLKSKFPAKRSKLERRIDKSSHHAEKKAQKEWECMLLLSSPSKCPLREQLLAEADHLVEQIKLHKEQLQSMQRNLKLIKKELKRSVLKASETGEATCTEAGTSSHLSPDLMKNSTKKKFLKKQKKQQRRIAYQVENLVATLSETILE